MGIQSIPQTVCPDREKDFNQLVAAGVASDAYVLHMETCPLCRAAVEKVFQYSARKYEELASIINRQKSK